MSKPWGWVTGFFTYETTKSVVVKSWSVGIINRVVQLLIILYFVCYVFYREKAYQVRDSGIQSSVMTKVKGFGYVNNHVMDVADYVAPTQGSAVFCIITKLIVTENQFQGRCPEVESSYKCDSDQDCSKHLGSYLGNGVITGSCVKSSQGNRCEMVGWCPAEVDKLQVKPMMEVENFTIFIKNSIRFPRFNVTRRTSGVVGMTAATTVTVPSLRWEMCCVTLDRTSLPLVTRFAKYYKSENGTDFRTLHKAYAIRFDILVTGLAGKFDPIPTLINIVAAFTSVGLGSILCDLILLNFLTGADQYKARKFEEVSESQIKILLSQKSISQQSVKPVSNDSGAVSLNLDQQL
ncbi:P2X purinoceptor 3a isoform X2 [Esox lucius]|uniref:P2X purinoceptor 3a isoform X2 n=1 Tax=Esox lucius TaxID=8010 RepID=UPI001476EE94|nr:P2X purinoceptor 3a isoform X2 [Esox lucius]